MGVENRKQPQANKTERSILGMMLLDQSVCEYCLENLSAGDFFMPAYQELYLAIASLYEEHKNIDLSSINDHLDSINMLPKIGGTATLIEIAQEYSTSMNYKEKVNTLKDRSVKRQIIKECNQVISNIMNGDIKTGEEACVIHQQKLQNIYKDSVSRKTVFQISEILEDSYNEIWDRQMRRKKKGLTYDGISTGMRELDRMINGLNKGIYYIVAARPSEGKTTLALNISEHVSKNHNVLFFSYEQDKRQLTEKVLSSCSKINFYKTVMAKSHWRKVRLVSDNLKNNRMFLDESCPDFYTLMSKIRRIHLEISLNLVVIDYFQLLPVPSKKSRYETFSEYSRKIQSLAKELQIPIILISQLSRETQKRANKSEDNDRPKLSDLKETGALEQDADIVIMLHRDSGLLLGEEGKREALIKKNRYGMTGPLDLYFQPQYSKFYCCTDANCPLNQSQQPQQQPPYQQRTIP